MTEAMGALCVLVITYVIVTGIIIAKQSRRIRELEAMVVDSLNDDMGDLGSFTIMNGRIRWQADRRPTRSEP